MKRTLWICLLFAINTSLFSQYIQVQPTENGGFYLAGAVIGQIDLDSTVQVGDYDHEFSYILARYDSLGQLEWHHVFETYTSGWWVNTLGGLAVSDSGDVWMAGRYGNRLLMDGVTVDTNLVPGGTRAYLARFDRSGQPVWFRKTAFSGTDILMEVILDDQDNAYLYLDPKTNSAQPAGYIFGNGASLYLQDPNATTVIIKVDSSGNTQWMVPMEYTPLVSSFLQHMTWDPIQKRPLVWDWLESGEGFAVQGYNHFTSGQNELIVCAIDTGSGTDVKRVAYSQFINQDPFYSWEQRTDFPIISEFSSLNHLSLAGYYDSQLNLNGSIRNNYGIASLIQLDSTQQYLWEKTPSPSFGISKYIASQAYPDGSTANLGYGNGDLIFPGISTLSLSSNYNNFFTRQDSSGNPICSTILSNPANQGLHNYIQQSPGKQNDSWVVGYHYFNNPDPLVVYHIDENCNILLQVELPNSHPPLIGIEEPISSPLILFPNPATDHIYLQIPQELKGLAKVQVFDLEGKVLQTQEVSISYGTALPLPVAGLSKGIYLVELEASERKWKGKFIKQ